MLCLISCLYVLSSAMMQAGCSKPNSDEDAPPPLVQAEPGVASELFDQLQFQNAVKKQGKVPAAPATTSLKKSFKDTLRLVEGIRIPIEFLHTGNTQNVAGMYVGSAGGSFYYVAAELKDSTDNDTVSVILMGFNKLNMTFPISFNITITPYDGAGAPIHEYTVPVKIEEPNDDPSKPSACGGLVLRPGEDWNWIMSYALGPNNTDGFVFMNYPLKKHGAGGQFIKGCCVNGKSFYNINCAGDTASQRSLLFPTYFQFPEESFRFKNDGTYDRLTIQDNANPDPPASNFCGNGKGVVIFKGTLGTYLGKWTIVKRAGTKGLPTFIIKNAII